MLATVVAVALAFAPAVSHASGINLATAPSFRVTGAVAADQIGGGGAAAIGDVNGDGTPDWALSSSIVVKNKPVGAVWVVYGPVAPGSSLSLANLPTSRGFKIDGIDLAVSGDVVPVVSAGDWNRDGFGDLVIGLSGPPPFGPLRMS